MKVYRWRLTGLVLLMAAGSLQADEDGSSRVADRPETQTQRWLQVQREGEAASSHAQTAMPAERERAMQRLLESFTHPIPEYFGEDDGGSFER